MKKILYLLAWLFVGDFIVSHTGGISTVFWLIAAAVALVFWQFILQLVWQGIKFIAAIFFLAGR